LKQQESPTTVAGYHSITRWLHAGLVLGVLFQLFAASMMAHPDHHGNKNKSTHVETSVNEEHDQAEGHHQQAVKHTQSAIHQDAGKQDHHTTANMMPPLTPAQEGGHNTHEASAWSAWLMEAHRNGGLLVAVIVMLNLFWAIRSRGNPRKRQISVLFSGQLWCQAWQILQQLPWMILGKKPLAEPGNALALSVEMLGILIMSVMAITGASIWFLWAGLGSMVTEEAMVLMLVHSTFAILLLIYLAGHITMALLHAKSGDAVFARISPLIKKEKQ